MLRVSSLLSAARRLAGLVPASGVALLSGCVAAGNKAATLDGALSRNQVAALIDQSRDSVVNDVVPWLQAGFGVVVAVLVAVVVVLVVWIRHNSYRVQKPKYEATRKVAYPSSAEGNAETNAPAP